MMLYKGCLLCTLIYNLLFFQFAINTPEYLKLVMELVMECLIKINAKARASRDR